MDYICRTGSPLGGITLASDGQSLTGLWFDGQNFYARTLDPVHTEKALPVFDEARRWLEIYFSGREPDFTPPLTLRGTAFQTGVWEILRAIPYGKTMTYGQIAEELALRAGLPRMSAQAVGGAVGRNPVSVIVPCHRVVGSDGSLTGYAGGLERKLRLLQMESADRSGIILPGKSELL